MDLGLHDRVAIVTGASRGIGRRVALDLAAEGAHVALVGRDGDALEQVAAAVARCGRRSLPVVADLADPANAAHVVERTIGELGSVDILVNNAGGGSPAPLHRLDDDDWRAGFEVNFFAAVRLAAACVPGMRERGWGRIVNVASTYGIDPDPLFGPYSAAKAALVNLSRNLALAYSAEGVLSTCVVPGVTLTELVEANAASVAAATGTSTDEVMEKMRTRHPVATGRFGRPEEVAAAVVFLASERASWITGAALHVDGGTH